MNLLDKVSFTSKRYADYFDFWKGHLREFGNGYRLACEHGSPAAAHKTRECVFQVDISDIIRLCSDNDTAIFVFVLSGIGVVMKRYAGKENIIIDTPLYRFGAAGEEYIQRVPVFLHVDEEITYGDLVDSLRNTMQRCYRFQNYPFQLLNGDPADSVFNTNLFASFEGIHQDPASVTSYDLRFRIKRAGSALHFTVEYNDGIIRPDVMENFHAHLKNVLQCARRLQAPVKEIGILSEEEQSLLLHHFNDTDVVPGREQTILERFQQQAAATPDSTALLFNGRRTTYRSLNEQANQLAHYLRNEYGTGREDVIGVMMDRSDLMIVCLLGILKAGAAYLPIDPAYPAERKQYMLKEAGARLLITDPLRLFDLDLYEGPVLSPELQLPLMKTSKENPGLINSGDDLAYIIFTSGSTGKPKGVQITHRSLLNYLSWATGYYLNGETPNGHFALFTSISFDFTITSIYCPLLTGGSLFIYEEGKSVEGVLSDCFGDTSSIDIIKLTPAHVSILEQLKIRSTNIRKVIVGGEELTSRQVSVLQAIDPDILIINEYGPTEATVGCIVEVIKDPAWIPIGKPIANTRIYILDEGGRLCPVGIPGEICIAGSSLSRGYVNQPQLTAKQFIPAPGLTGPVYRTGDRGRWTPRGEILYMGRIDDQIKIRGYRVEPAEVERVLLMHELVQEAVVIAKQDERGDKSLVAFVVAPGPADGLHILNFVRNTLPEYMTPAYCHILEKLPLTNNGKVDREALAAMKLSYAGPDEGYVAPVSPVEKALAAIFEAALGRSPLGMQDNFFSHGMDSLKAIKAIIQINNNWGATLSIVDIFKHPTLRELMTTFSFEAGEHRISDELRLGLERIARFKEQISGEAAQNKHLPDGCEDIYPLTPIEGGMIYSSLLRVEEPVYYDQFSFSIEIHDLDKFIEAIKLLTQRHAILRTRYYMSTFSESAKVVMKGLVLPLTFSDITGLPADEQRNVILQYSRDDLATRLSFNGDILWHMKVFRISDTRYLLVWSFHHAILDGWSTGIFKTELSKLVGAETLDLSVLPPLQHSYKEYCAFVLGRSDAPTLHEYWRNTLAGYVRNKLPFNYAGKKRKEGKGGMHSARRYIGPDLLQRLNLIVEQHQVTFKAICVSAHIYLMHAICAEDDVVTGVVTHDRPPISDGDRIMGCFLNTVPIRIKVNETGDCLSLIRSVNKYLIDVMPYETHLSEIAKIAGDKAGSGNPVFDCLLNYTDFHVFGEWEANETFSVNYEGMEWVLDNYSSEMTNTLFDLEVDRTYGNLSCRIKYVPAYFEREDVIYALDLYERILQQFADLPSARIDVSSLLNEAELRHLVYDFNDTVTAYSKTSTLHGLFEEQVRKDEGRAAVRFNGQEISYGALNRRANRIACMLIDKGVSNGDNVGLLAGRGFEMIAGMYGIMKAGAAYVPVDPLYAVDRQRYILEQSSAAIVLADREYPLQRAADTGFMFLNMAMAAGDHYDDKDLQLAKSSDELAYTIYTSGSTGRPKGVMIAHHSAVNLVEWVNRKYGIGAGDRLLFITSMCFDLSVYDIFGILAAGGTVVAAETEDVQDVRRLQILLEDEKITFWDSVPTTMNYLVNELDASGAGFVQHQLRLVFLSGDWIPVSLPARLGKYFPQARVISLGGATEGTVWSNYYEIDKVDDRWTSIPYGKPLANNFFYILNRQLKPVPRGIAGDLYIGGTGVAVGYANDAEKTQKAFMPDPFNTACGGRMYRTGDLGRMLPDGNMEFLGRNDHQVKIRGYRVELAEVEHQLLKYEGVEEGVVTARKDEQGNNYLCAYVVSREEVSWQQLREHLLKELPPYMTPGSFVRLEKLPLTTNGKIDRQSLPDPEGPVAGKGYVQPETETEIRLAQIWQELLGIGQIGLHDDFLELGAHSLIIGAFVNRVHREMNVVLSLTDVFRHTTLKEIAGIVALKERHAYTFIEAVPEQEHYEVSHAQKRLWLNYQLEADQIAYNIPGAYIIRGDLDVRAFGQAVETLVARHESLRTYFITVDGLPRQKICPPGSSGFAVAYQEIAEKERENVRELVLGDAATPFDLAAGPLVRAKLLRLRKDEHVFIFTMHHIISDGASTEVMIREIVTLYESGRKGAAAILPPLNIQYKDYAAWQNKVLAGEGINVHHRYWMSRFSDGIPTLNIPSDFARPAVKTYGGDRIILKLGTTYRDDLQTIGHSNGASLFMVLLACVKALLYRYSNQADIVVGTPVAGRDHVELEGQIGFFVNLLALRTKIEEDERFSGLLQKIRQHTLDAYEHQAYPFDKLVSELVTGREKGRSPVFDVRVELNHIEDRETFSDLYIQPYEQELFISHFDLTFNFVVYEGSLSVYLVYATDLFRRETAHAIISDLEKVIACVLNNPSVRLSEIPLGGMDGKPGSNKIVTSFDFLNEEQTL